jgi:hypothetical protein
VDLVGGDHPVVRVAHVPPELVAGHLDGQRRLRRAQRQPEGERVDEHRQQDRRRHHDAGDDHEAGGAAGRPVRRPLAPTGRQRREKQPEGGEEDGAVDGEHHPPALGDAPRVLARRVERGLEVGAAAGQAGEDREEAAEEGGTAGGRGEPAHAQSCRGNWLAASR